MKASRRPGPSPRAWATLASLLLIAPAPAVCAPHAALLLAEQECRCISLPAADSDADAAVVQFAMTSGTSRRVAGDACASFASPIQQWRQSENGSDVQALADVLADGKGLDVRGLLQFITPIPASVLEEIEAGEAQAVSDGLGMETVKNKELHSGAVVCRAVDLDANGIVMENPRIIGLCMVVLLIFAIACAAEILGRVGGRVYRRFFAHRYPSAIMLNDEKPLWMASTTFHDLKMALDEDDEDSRSSVL